MVSLKTIGAIQEMEVIKLDLIAQHAINIT